MIGQSMVSTTTELWSLFSWGPYLLLYLGKGNFMPTSTGSEDKSLST